MSTKIFVVEGACGEYSDHQEWPVMAYTKEKDARKHALAASTAYRAWAVKGKPKREHGIANPYDPMMVLEGSGTNYYYYPVELREKFDEAVTVQHVPPPHDESADYAICVHTGLGAYFYCSRCKMLMCDECWVKHCQWGEKEED